MTCPKCGGLIGQNGVTYGYAGPWCSCPPEPQILTPQFEFVKFPKPTPKKKKDMMYYANLKKLKTQGHASRRDLNQLRAKNKRTAVKKAGKKVKRTKIARIKQIPLKDLVKKADKVFSLWIIKRDGNKCVTPDPLCKSYLQASHLIKRGRKLVRWDEHNVHSQCQHHNYNHDQGFHPSPEILTNYVINKYGVEEYNRLFKLSKVDAPSSWVREKALEVIKKYT